MTVNLGNASGTASNANGIQFVTYRGEENFWGNIWWWVDGLNENMDATRMSLAKSATCESSKIYAPALLSYSDPSKAAR